MERFLRITRSLAKDVAIVVAIMVALMSFLRMADARELADGVDTALVFVVDASSSMDEEQLQLARESHAQAITSPQVMDAIRAGHFRRSAFAFVEFASRGRTIVGWTIVDGPESAATFAWQILHNERSGTGELTGIGEGLAEALALMNSLPAEPLYRVVDIVGDGTPNAGTNPALVRPLLLAMGVTINGMPVLDTANADIEDYYAQELIGGPRAFSIPLSNMQDMPTLMRRKLIIEIG